MLFRIVAALLGLSIVALLFLAYEDEHGHIQSRLEEWWVRLDDARLLSRNKQRHFMQKIASATARALDRIFGHKLLSLEAVAVAATLSCASIILSQLIAIGTLAIFIHFQVTRDGLASLFLLILGLLLVAGALVAKGRRERSSTGQLLTLLVVSLIAAAMAIVPYDKRRFDFDLSLRYAHLSYEYGYIAWRYSVRLDFASSIRSLVLAVEMLASTVRFALAGAATGSSTVALVVFFGLATDCGFIAFTRQLLRLASDWTSPFRIAAALVANAAGAVFLVLSMLIPLLAPLAATWAYGGREAVTSYDWTQMGQVALFLGLSNLIDIGVALAFAVIAGAVLTHNLLWPLAVRLLYRLAMFRSDSTRKVLAATAAVLLGWSLGVTPEVLLRWVQ